MFAATLLINYLKWEAQIVAVTSFHSGNSFAEKTVLDYKFSLCSSHYSPGIKKQLFQMYSS